MKGMVTAFVSIALVSTGVALPTPAKAWGKMGHLTICDMAYRNLTDASRAELKTIFRIGQQGAAANARVYARFNNSCLEEDEFPRKRAKDHFINFTRNTPDVTGPNCPIGAATCIVAAIDKDLGVLRNSTETPKKRARALMSIGHWVGDIHQPLHISFEDDRGGNEIRAKGVCGNGKDNSLHSVWDNCLIDKTLFALVRNESCFAGKNWKPTTITYRGVDILLGVQPYGNNQECQVSLTGPATDAKIREWQSTRPWQWARESYLITLEKDRLPTSQKPSVGYCKWDQVRSECRYEGATLEYAEGATKKEVDITEAYVNHFGPIAVERAEKAGYRLAHLINTSLDPNYRGR
jgi:S1/P1 Nuclease